MTGTHRSFETEIHRIMIGREVPVEPVTTLVPLLNAVEPRFEAALRRRTPLPQGYTWATSPDPLPALQGHQLKPPGFNGRTLSAIVRAMESPREAFAQHNGKRRMPVGVVGLTVTAATATTMVSGQGVFATEIYYRTRQMGGDRVVAVQREIWPTWVSDGGFSEQVSRLRRSGPIIDPRGQRHV